MIGSIIGDIVGSRFEFANHRSKDFKMFTSECGFTDDTIMTMAVADALWTGRSFDTSFRDFGKRYPHPMGGYGGSFARWLSSPGMQPYNSFGNGSAMRVSPVAMHYRKDRLEDVLTAARKTAECTHNHPEGIKGAQCVAHLIWSALNGADRDGLRNIASGYYDIGGLTVDGIRKVNRFDETCQGTVPQSIVCVLEAVDFEDAVRNAISIGGDSDTIGAIAGGIAEAIFGIPGDIIAQAMGYLTDEFKYIVRNEYAL